MKNASTSLVAALTGGVITFIVLFFLGPELNPWPATVVVAVLAGLLGWFLGRRSHESQP